MRFTMARPEVSCHPELLLDGAQDCRRRGALLLPRTLPSRRSTRGVCRGTRGVTSTPSCARGSTRSAERLGGSYRVLVDESTHVDRAAAVRAGIAFYGKNTMAITRRHGSWVVLGVARHGRRDRAHAGARPRLRRVQALHRRVSRPAPSTSREPSTRTKCLSYWTQAPVADTRGVPRGARGDGLRL